MPPRAKPELGTNEDSANMEVADSVRYAQAWQRLAQRLKWLWIGQLTGVSSGALGVLGMGWLALRRDPQLLNWGGPLVFIAVLGGAGLWTVGGLRALEFRCPRCRERFFMAGDMLFGSVYARAECRYCKLGRNSAPQARRWRDG